MKKRKRQCRTWPEIAEILESYRKSGLTQSSFCAGRNLALSTLSYWLRRERERKAKVGSRPSASRQLVPVRVVDDPRASIAGSIEVESETGYAIRFPLGVDPDLVARYMHALEAQC